VTKAGVGFFISGEGGFISEILGTISKNQVGFVLARREAVYPPSPSIYGWSEGGKARPNGLRRRTQCGTFRGFPILRLSSGVKGFTIC